MGNEMNEFERGVMAPADGNAGVSVTERGIPRFADSARNGGTGESIGGARDNGKPQDAARNGYATMPEMGPNFERLEELRPELVNALRELVRQYRMEGVAARRHEIRRIRQARLFWQGMQYAWWNNSDMNWHLPYEHRSGDDRELEEMPRYQFVTNFYQGFGLSFVAVLSQDVPSVRFYP
jgi:hypothetical protein